jgi:hypothetical protein
MKLSPNHAFNRTPPIQAFYLASVGGGGPVNLVSLGMNIPCRGSQ